MEIIFKTSLGIIAALFTLAHSSIALADDTLTRLSRTPLTIELAGFIIGVLIVLIFLERRASRKVRRAEATLRAIFEAEPECIKVTDKSGALVKMNPAGLAMIEADDAEQVIGNSVFGLVAAEDRSLFKSMHEQVLTGEPSVLRFRMQGLKGTRRLMESHSVRIRNPITDEPHVLAITRDITKRRLTEIAVERSNKLLDAIREAQEAVISDTAKDKVFNSLLGTLLKHTDSEYGFIGEVFHDASGAPYLKTHAITNIAWDAQSRALHDQYIRSGLEFRNLDTLFGRVLRSSERLISNDPLNDPRAGGLPPGHPPLNAFLGLPLMHEGVMIGMAGVANRPEGYDDALCQFIQPLITTCSTLIAAYRVEQARQKAEEELTLAHMVFENTNEAILVTDENICIIAVNPAFTRTTGYSLEEVVGKNPSVLSSGKQNKDFYEAMWHSISTTGQWQGEIWNRRKSGEEYVEWLTINTIFHQDGSPHRRVALFSDITEKKNAEDLIWTHENYDLLTSLPNRRLLVDRMEQKIKKSERDHSMVAAIIIDIDHFNHINDSFGFQVGDMALVEIGKRISACVRDSDTVSRSGGDEFIVALAGLNDAAEIGRISQDIINALEQPLEVLGHEMLLSACIGAAVFPHDAQTASEVLVAAGHAVKYAQQEGTGHFRLYKQSMQEAALIRMRVMRDLRQALAEDQFQIYFQPIVELSSGRIRKAEALIRWIHPEHGLISPADFIPVAEDTGAIHQIGDWVFRRAANQVKCWREIIDPDFQISVNKSPVQFHDLDGLHHHWVEYLQELKLPGSAIVVEITEGLLMHADGPIADKLLHFSRAGVQVAIDDFGTGYSALSYLKKFDVDYLKIDQSFVRNLAPNTSDMALCEAIIMMAHTLGLKVIAEGIESESQRDLLKDIGCDFGQGYLFSKPLPADEFEKLLKYSH